MYILYGCLYFTPPFVFDFHSGGSRLFVFRLRFYTCYIDLPECMTPPSEEQFAVLTSLVSLRHALVNALYCCIRARAAGRGSVTWDATFLFLYCSPEGSQDGRRELLTIRLLSAFGSCALERAWDLVSITEPDRGGVFHT